MSFYLLVNEFRLSGCRDCPGTSGRYSQIELESQLETLGSVTRGTGNG